MARSVLIIYTGGTIGMMEDPESRSLIPFDFEQLSHQVPELTRFDLVIDAVSFDPILDSSNIQVEHWQQMARQIESNYEQYDGFVVLHGTDTMAYSASALSFMLRGLQKPVIFTGSQLPIGVLRTDGKENLITSIQLAGMASNNTPVIREVAIYFGSALYRGNRTHKYSTEAFDAIHSPNLPALAEAGIHVQFRTNLFPVVSEETPFSVQYEMDSRVAVLKLFPGIRKEVVQGICSTPNLKGLIIETFGSGNSPDLPWFIEELGKLREKGVFMVNVTQCSEGFVEQGRYATSTSMMELGVIPAADMTFEAALTKMMYLIPQCGDVETFGNQMLTPMRGELTSYSSLV
ncbi:asparaginase [Sanyastnella coralliicola]|uniref:asparaginase n=1 Tax=Sanyastnella coralliicola TaxID=3069118 RepID=UPI0027B8D5C0|nr:asparaginase [Longitalea sp. SCSIO 12813]